MGLSCSTLRAIKLFPYQFASMQQDFTWICPKRNPIEKIELVQINATTGPQRNLAAPFSHAIKDKCREQSVYESSLLENGPLYGVLSKTLEMPVVPLYICRTNNRVFIVTDLSPKNPEQSFESDF